MALTPEAPSAQQASPETKHKFELKAKAEKEAFVLKYGDTSVKSKKNKKVDVDKSEDKSVDTLATPVVESVAKKQKKNKVQTLPSN